MNSLSSRKQLLVAEAMVHRELLGADAERIVDQARLWRGRLASVQTLFRAGSAASQVFGLFRSGAKDSGTSKLSTVLQWLRTGWTVWSAWQAAQTAGATAATSTSSTPAGPAPDPAKPEPDAALAAALAALRTATATCFPNDSKPSA
jgi:hypothetical protein